MERLMLVEVNLLFKKNKMLFFICHDPGVLYYVMCVCVLYMLPHVCTSMGGGLQLSLGVCLDRFYLTCQNRVSQLT